MHSFELVYICLSALIAVFFVLLVLAFLMRLINIIFPAAEQDETTLYAAIATTINNLYPGNHITKIEELK